MGDDAQNFEWAVKNGDFDQVKAAVSQDKGIVNKAFASSGRYPLCVAADYGQTEVIEYLISNGADVNVSDKYGITPLLSAIFEGHVESVKLLLSKGASKTGKAPDGSTYLESAETDEIRALLK